MRKYLFSTGSQRGSVLVIALIFTTVSLILTGIYLSAISVEYRLTRRSYESTAAMNLAEAGAEKALWELIYGEGSWTGWIDEGGNKTRAGNLETPEDTIGEYSVTVSDLTNPSIKIKSTGYAGRMEKVVKLVIERDSAFRLAAFGDTGGVRLDGNAYTDSYDSTDPDYTPDAGNIGTNSVSDGAISLDGNAIVYGDAIMGPGGNISTGIVTTGNSSIEGTEAAASSRKDLPQITAPSGLTNKGSLSVDGNDTVTIDSDGEYSSISVSGNGVLIINTSVSIYISGNLSVSGNGIIRIINDADVTIYVGGSISLSGNGMVNESQDPTSLSLYGTDSCTSVQFTGNADFYGAVYARKANIEASGNGEVYGSLTGDGITLSGNAAVHHDHALKGDPGAPGAGFELISWQGR